MKSKYNRSYGRRDAVVSRSQCFVILNAVGFLHEVPYNSLYESAVKMSDLFYLYF